MKKFISIFICFNLLILNQGIICAEIIQDNLLKKLDKNLKTETQKQIPIIDDFALKTLNQNLKITKENQEIIEDELVKNSLRTNAKITKEVHKPIQDNLAISLNESLMPKNNTIKAISTFDKIKISPIKNYTTRKAQLNDKIEFILMEDIKINNISHKKGEKISANIENLSQNGAYGVPADLVVGNFKIGNQILDGTLTRQGANRAIWVYPSAYVLSVFFGLGLFVLPIRGGHAKLKPNKIYEIDI